MSKLSRARKPLLRRTGASGLAHSDAFRGSGAPCSGATGEAGTSLLKLAGLAGVVTTAFLALSVAPAFAARGHEYLGETFGTPCPALEVPCGAGKLKEPSAVAVNETTGEVYVLDQGNSRVVGFSPAGVVLGEFDGSGELPGEGAEAGAGGLPGESGGAGSNPGERGTPTGRFSYPSEAQNGALAVDNYCALHPALSESECKAEDPSAGDVYVVDAGPGGLSHRVIDKYTASGEYVGQITAAGSESLNALEGVAVDREGVVWVYVSGGGSIDSFAYTTPTAFEFTGGVSFSGHTGFPKPGFAVDSQGDFYVRRTAEGADPGRITKRDHTGAIINREVDAEPSTAVGVDQAADTAYVDNLESVAAFDPEGNELERLGFEGELEEGAGIGVNHQSGFAYVADSAAGQLLVMAPQLPGPPSVEAANQFATEVTSSGAELHSEVNPQSEADEGATTYRFAYGPCPSLAACEGAPYPLSTPAATLSPDFEARPVAAELAGLSPHTAYHWRVVAENEHSEPEAPTLGPAGTFTTQPAGFLALPDSRQWQLVSPPEKQGTRLLPIWALGVTQAAADGSGIAYLAEGATEPEPEGYSNLMQVLSTRGPSEWSTRDLAVPHAATAGLSVGLGWEYRYLSSDLSLAAVQPFGPFDPAISPEASESTAFLRETSPSCGALCFHPLVTATEPFANVPQGTVFGEAQGCEPRPSVVAESIVCGPQFVGATEDLSHLLLRAGAELKPGAGKGQLYEWFAGQLSQVSVLTDGQPAPPGAEPGLHVGWGAISTDGERIVWRAKTTGEEHALYLRANATAPQSASGACDEAGRACTLQLDATEAGGCTGCESGGGVFQFASADGSRVYFTDTHKLTSDSGAAPKKADLYECRIEESAEGELTCALTDLTPKTATPGEEPAAVDGSILGASRDGEFVYFVADGVLADNVVDNGAGPEEAQPGNCSGGNLSAACNLYLTHEGTITFVAPLSREDEHDWRDLPALQPTRASADGRFLSFMAQEPLTGYDNQDTATGKPVAEVYLYDATAARLLCASCDPTGARPVGVEYETIEAGNQVAIGAIAGTANTWFGPALVAANLPGWTTFATSQSLYQPRYLLSSGRLFFNSVDGLVPQDSNGTADVYQYEPPGVGGCTASDPTFSEQDGGCVGLISAGTSREQSAFLDASESGGDVFFLTSSKLVPADVDTARDVYDAHACPPGATVPCLPGPPPPPPLCQGDACQQPAVPPNHPTPGTALQNGPENVLECPKGKVKRHGKCVVKHHRKHHRKKSHRRAAGHNGGGGK